jgi:hypothetical protein
VSSSGLPRSRQAQRARTAEPAEENPSPTPTAVTSVMTSGSRSSTETTSRVRLRLQTSPATTSTRACPTRSIIRPHTGAATAPTTVAVAVMMPARAYDPVVAETSSTIPSAVIDSGSRATNPARLNARARGSDSTVR